jgi:hypothetical protein
LKMKSKFSHFVIFSFSHYLFNLFVNGNLFEVWIEFLKLQTLRVVLFVFNGNVTAGSGHIGVLLLGAFQDYLYTVSFLCHWYKFENMKISKCENEHIAPFSPFHTCL